MIKLLTLLLFFQFTTPSVKLTFDVFPLSRSSNPGWYNIYRVAKTGDYCAGDLQWIGHVPQTYDASGRPISPVFIDTKPLLSACYSVSFIQTPSGTSIAVETEHSDSITVP